MFESTVDLEVQRLVVAPDWPTLDELFDRYPPTAPDPTDGYDDIGPGDGGLAPRLGVIADVAPCGWTALDLDTVTDDPVGLGDDELIDAMVGFGRVEAWAQARQTRLVAEFDRRRPGPAARWAPDEVSLAMAVSRTVAAGRIGRARRLVDTLTDTLALFESGRIDDDKVRLVCEAVDSELDHTIPFPLGPTAEHNLTDGCATHHHEKHAPGWAVVQHPDGHLDWITPTGHTYTSEVHDYRPVPPPPAPHIPGPIADRTHTQPVSAAPAARPPRMRYDWSGGRAAADDPAPF